MRVKSEGRPGSVELLGMKSACTFLVNVSQACI